MKNKKVKDTDARQLENAKLKKELAQKNRELEIEAALERVRARTMAMQKSDELLDAASLLFEQVKSLGCNPFSVGFVLLDRNKPDGEFFMSADGKFQPSVFIPNNDESAESNMYLHWVKGAKPRWDRTRSRQARNDNVRGRIDKRRYRLSKNGVLYPGTARSILSRGLGIYLPGSRRYRGPRARQ